MRIFESLLESKLTVVGRHRHVPDSNYDQDQLIMGIEIEKEHTDDENLAKEIAKDHLEEIPDYYTRLKKMESDYEEESKRKG